MKPPSHRIADTCLNCKHCWAARGHLFCVRGDNASNQSGGDMFSASFDFNGSPVDSMDDGEFEELWVSHSVTNYETCDNHEREATQ